jgi:hypothetical protein
MEIHRINFRSACFEWTIQLTMVCIVLFVAGGCGRNAIPTAHLNGAVTIKGKAIPPDAKASLSFAPAKGGESISVPIVDSRYDSPETPAGSVSVKFYISKLVGPEKVSQRTGEKYHDIANLVPPEHAAGMVIEVSGDNANQDFAL